MLRLDELAEFFEEEPIEDDDVDTIGGLVVKTLGRIAKVGDITIIRDMTCIVKEVDGARVTKLQIEKEPQTEIVEE